MRINVIILAAGEGKRFKSPLPKVLAEVGGKPMIVWVVEAVEKSNVTDRPVVVVGAGAEQVKAVAGDRCDYVVQEQQLGTGHAVAVCRPMLEGTADAVVVLYGDMPLVTPATIRRLVDAYAESNTVLTMATVTVPDFSDWRGCFASYGRIIRDAAGKLERIVEVRDATPAQRLITEVNPSLFCIRASWLWHTIGSLRGANAQGELYLTDLLGLAIAQGQPVASLPLEPREGLGANSLEELAVIHQLARATPPPPSSPRASRAAVHVSSGAVVIRIWNGEVQVLVMHRTKTDSWHLPKGTQVPGETIEATAVREVREETGMQVTLGRYLGSLESIIRRGGQTIPKVTHYFLADPTGGSSAVHDAEHDEVVFLPYQQALQHLEDFALHEREGKILRMVNPRTSRG